jgi:DNA-binding CsgD family transcriptional regulator
MFELALDTFVDTVARRERRSCGVPPAFLAAERTTCRAATSPSPITSTRRELGGLDRTGALAAALRRVAATPAPPPRGAHQLHGADEGLQATGAEAWGNRAGVELRATGARQRVAETRDELTARERQVAQLAAAGESSAEIAAQLFISPRTVAYQLPEVFGKLVVTSRDQLRRFRDSRGRGGRFTRARYAAARERRSRSDARCRASASVPSFPSLPPTSPEMQLRTVDPECLHCDECAARDQGSGSSRVCSALAEPGPIQNDGPHRRRGHLAISPRRSRLEPSRRDSATTTIDGA